MTAVLGAIVAQEVLGEVKSTAEARWHVFGDYFLANPFFLALLPIALIVFAYGRSKRGRVSARMSALPRAALRRSWAQRLGWIPAVLQIVAFACLCVALSRPVRGDVLTTKTSEGVDIALVIDRSGSMQYTDLDPNRTRLEVVKEVVGDFAVRRMTDRVDAADNVALVTFARYPQLLCPFTLDVEALESFLDSVELVKYEAEDGTAIGRGLAKAVSILKESEAKSKVVVLLTDGENNVDDITPAQAAQLAFEQKVRVYTVLAGQYVYQQDLFGRIYASQDELDTTDLRKIAEVTGGRFFRARDRQTLERVYEEIEELERTPRTEERRTETFDLYPLFLAPGLFFYLLAWLSGSTWARRLT